MTESAKAKYTWSLTQNFYSLVYVQHNCVQVCINRFAHEYSQLDGVH